MTCDDPLPRIAPLEPPFEPGLQAQLERINPPGAPSVLALFRLLARHPELMDRMRVWGGYFLSPKSTLSLRDREVVIDRACARCGAEYEWGVHVAAFTAAAGFSEPQNRAIADPSADDASLTPRDRLLVQMVDELHETSTVGDALWAQLAAAFDERQLLELLMLAGWYRAISYACNAVRIPPEAWARRWR
ncbi:MAG: carboxymuconolactone decarboxylase family protein [Burkholderiales bacterium]|nr:carboxymuconolactone decarboxylase family protein [Burkholderiales bacterium]